MTWINLGQYAARLTEEMARASAVDPARITLETAIEDVWVGLDIATPGGLLLQRALDQLLQARVPRGLTGRVRVELRATAEQTLVLQVGDTGCGFPEELDFQTTDSLGGVCSGYVYKHAVTGFYTYPEHTPKRWFKSPDRQPPHGRSRNQKRRRHLRARNRG